MSETSTRMRAREALTDSSISFPRTAHATDRDGGVRKSTLDGYPVARYHSESASPLGAVVHDGAKTRL
jgi:hypothetical protein